MNQSTRLTTVDLPTLLANLHRSSIGFDRMFDILNHSSAARQSTGNYPPYDIVKYNELCYAIHIAVAGFKEDELDITVEGNVLKIVGNQVNREEQEYLFQGISARSFERTFNLAEHVVVKSAKCENGMLVINLEVEVPEELKPRRIEIKTAKQINYDAVGHSGGGNAN